MVVADRAYLDFGWLHQLQQRGVTFVTRLKRNVRYQVVREHDVDIRTGVLSDQTIELTSARSRKAYPDTLRRVGYWDEETRRSYVFVTNNTTWVGKTIANLYKSRWQIELFFKWIKQHLKVKRFVGRTKNAVLSQLWVATCMYLRGCPRRSGKLVATPARLWYQSGVFNKEERPPMKKPYKIVSGASTPNSRELADWLAKDGQLLIPLVELLEKGERAIDEVIDVMGRATIEAVLQMSAAQVAGPKEQGRRDADREVYWHGVQAGRVALKERQLQVDKPRLRKKRRRADEPGEVEIPAYTALQADQRLADRMLELVLRGVSTRKYETVLPAMADQVGVSKSEVSRETIEAGTRVLKELVERDLSELDVLVVYLDGIVFGDYHVLAAVGVDADGRKHVLGLCGGASENTEVTAGLLEDLVARGLRADRRRLFVIDGAKALRQAIGRVFGSSNLVQRCRNHKVRNVLGHLPKEQHEQARSTLRAAWKLDADEGIRKLEQYASWLEREWPSAAGSLREGLSELFTVNRLGLPKPLRRCLTTTNIIDSSHAGVRQHTNRVSRWQSEEMAVRWAAVTFRETEKHYRRITGYEHLWMLKAHLDEEDGVLAELQKAG